jgi:GTP cyclohydrolase I
MTSTPDESGLTAWLSSLHPQHPELASSIIEACAESPGRISAAYRELLSGYSTSVEEIVKVTASLDEDEEYAGIVAANAISFVSFCAHHFLPFFGTVDLAYQPGGMIVGIGKLPRLVDMHARRFQIQEFLARDICADLMGAVRARGAFVEIKARHLCVCGRGPNKPGAWNVTTYGAGSLRSLKTGKAMEIGPASGL